MATAAVIGLSSGAKLLGSSFFHSDLTEKFSYATDQPQVACGKNAITAKKTSNYSSSFRSSKRTDSIKALKEYVSGASTPSTAEPWLVKSDNIDKEVWDHETSLDALLLLQKSMLEKQWNMSFEHPSTTGVPSETTEKKTHITSSGVRARTRRLNNRRTTSRAIYPVTKKLFGVVTSPELLQSRLTGYNIRGVISHELLTHSEVVQLSQKIKTGLSLEKQRLRLTEKLGCEPSEEQLAKSLRMNRAEVRSKLIECSLAKEKLSMSNIRFVISIAQKYDNMGAEMADLVQGGLIGLLRGIEKFDPSKGFKISTYVYWWIRQGVRRALADHNSRMLRLPNHLHERINLIRGAKIRLEQKGVTPSIDRIAESLNMSPKKITNATEAIRHVVSLDREAFSSFDGLPGETYHSYIADNRVENSPWHVVDECALKDEVNKLINTTLRPRERDIVRLYYGLDNECLSWEDIGERIGLSRERVRQLGLVAVEKLKHAARKNNLEALLVKH
ncbi:hypothetical protein Dimus_024045 [Dionaea muscipula]